MAMPLWLLASLGGAAIVACCCLTLLLGCICYQCCQVRSLRRRLRKAAQVLPPSADEAAAKAEVEAAITKLNEDRAAEQEQMRQAEEARSKAEAERIKADEKKTECLVRCACTAVASATAEVLHEMEKHHDVRMLQIEKRVLEEHEALLAESKGGGLAQSQGDGLVSTAKDIGSPCPECKAATLTLRTVSSEASDNEVYTVMTCAACGYCSEPQLVQACKSSSDHATDVQSSAICNDATGPSCESNENQLASPLRARTLPPLRSSATLRGAACASQAARTAIVRRAEPFEQWMEAERQREQVEHLRKQADRQRLQAEAAMKHNVIGGGAAAFYDSEED